jgi:predicted small secreted protein
MRGITKELLTAFMVLTGLYLVLINFTGFGKDVSSLGSASVNLFKVAQGR